MILRPTVLFSLAFAAGALVPGLVGAQAARAESPAASASAAMERAQRLAANPMRVILQASKFRRRAGEAEAVAEPVRSAARAAPAVAVVSAAATGAAATPRPAPSAGAAVASPPVAGAPTLPAPAAGPAGSAGAAPAAPIAPAADAGPAVVAVGAADVAAGNPAPAAPAAVASAAPERSAAAPMAAAPASAGLPELPSAGAVAKAPPPAALAEPPVTALPAQQPPAAAPLALPRLVTMVEPEIPGRVLLDPARVSEVLADLTVQPDGSVSAVSLASNVPRSWQRYILAALQRWRFEPLPAARVHRVQLVFGD